MSSSAFLITQTNPTAGRFVPPGDVRGWDRYAYVENNPLRYADPSGHWMCGDEYDPGCAENAQEVAEYGIMIYESGILGNNPGSNDPEVVINDFWSTDIHASGNLLRFIVGWEGFSDKAYVDSNGYCTIGYGHNCTAEDLSMYANYSLFDFWDLFLKNLKNAESGVRKAFQDLDNLYFSERQSYTLGNYVSINQAEFDALVDFSFNAGVGRVNDLIAGNLVSVNSAGKPIKNIVEFEKALRVDFSGVGGIEIRRIQEIEIFLHQNYDNSH